MHSTYGDLQVKLYKYEKLFKMIEVMNFFAGFK